MHQADESKIQHELDNAKDELNDLKRNLVNEKPLRELAEQDLQVAMANEKKERELREQLALWLQEAIKNNR